MSNKKNITTGNMALNKYRASIDTIVDNELMDNNYYAQLIFELFETAYMPEYETVKTWKRHFGRPFQVNIKQYEAIQKINKKINILRTESPSFDDMFEFGTFIKILEKVYMYRNDKDAKIVCDSNIDDSFHRVLVIQGENYFIKFALERHFNGEPNTIDISVERMYGKNMKTNYHIENRISNAKDSTDVMLLNNITMLLKEKMVRLLIIYGNIIVNKHVEAALEGTICLTDSASRVERYDTFFTLDYGRYEKEWYEDLQWYLKHVYK